MSLKDNYLKSAKKFGGPYAVIKFGIKRGLITSIMQGSDIGISKAYEISKVLGVSLEELYPGWTQAERISEHPELYGMPGYPYSPDERHYIALLTEILRGKNQKNARAIKENIEAFHYSKDLSPAQTSSGALSRTTGDRGSADCPDAAPKKTAENGK